MPSICSGINFWSSVDSADAGTGCGEALLEKVHHCGAGHGRPGFIAGSWYPVGSLCLVSVVKDVVSPLPALVACCHASPVL